MQKPSSMSTPATLFWPTRTITADNVQTNYLNKIILAAFCFILMATTAIPVNRANTIITDLETSSFNASSSFNDTPTTFIHAVTSTASSTSSTTECQRNSASQKKGGRQSTGSVIGLMVMVILGMLIVAFSSVYRSTTGIHIEAGWQIVYCRGRVGIRNSFRNDWKLWRICRLRDFELFFTFLSA